MTFQARIRREVSTMKNGNSARQNDLATVSRAEESPVTEGPELALITPTLNERDNIEPLVDLLDAVLASVSWEVIFVDDDSPDGTAERIREIGRRDRRVRCLQGRPHDGLHRRCPRNFRTLHRRYGCRHAARR
jgi:cellulose synthase/poly-beta-1,6-N-acetylglucosamine synthase-like glycosyltransferase